MPSAVLRLWGQVSGGPSGVPDQSLARISAPSSPPPCRKAAPASVVGADDRRGYRRRPARARHVLGHAPASPGAASDKGDEGDRRDCSPAPTRGCRLPSNAHTLGPSVCEASDVHRPARRPCRPALFARTPGFTAVAVLTLALGIAATTAIYSVVHATFFEPLPYRDAERLVMVWSQHPGPQRGVARRLLRVEAGGARRLRGPDRLDRRPT